LRSPAQALAGRARVWTAAEVAAREVAVAAAAHAAAVSVFFGISG
jgi:hypothetical protein